MDDFRVANGSLAGLVAVNKKNGYASRWELGFTPDAEGMVTISLGQNAARDAGGLGNEAAADVTVRANFGAPTRTITDMPGYWLPDHDPFTITVRFSEPVRISLDRLSKWASITYAEVSNPVPSDFVPPAGVADTCNYDPDDFTVTPPGGETDTCFYRELTFTVKPDTTARYVFGWIGEDRQWWDDGGNIGGHNDIVPQVYFRVDPDPPTVTIAREGDSDPVTGAFNLKLEFNEPVSLNDVSKISVANGTATNPARHLEDEDGSTYVVRVTPASDGAVTYTLAPGSFLDRAGHTHAEAVHTATASLPPIAVLSTAAQKVSADFDIAIAFSEAVTGFEQADLSVTNGVVKSLALNTGSETGYTATITPAVGDRKSNVRVLLPAGKVEDSDGNANPVSNTLTVRAVPLGPIPVITGPAGPVAGPFPVTVRFDKGLTSFTGIETGNGTSAKAKDPEGSPNPHTWYYTITPTDTAWVTVDVPEEAGVDSAGQTSSRAGQYRVLADIHPPEVTLRTAGDEVPAGQATFDVYVEFSESVEGLALTAGSDDLVVKNGQYAGLTLVGPNTYVTRVTATADGPVTITMPAGTVRDRVGNPNAETSLTVTADVPPSVTISTEATEPVSVGEDLALTVTFSEPVTGFDILDVVVQRGKAVRLTGSGAVYTLTVVPGGVDRGCLYYDPVCGPYDQVGVRVPAGAARDTSGNPSLPSNHFSIKTNVDPYRPTIKIRRMEPYRISVGGREYETCGIKEASDPPPVTGPFYLEFRTSASADLRQDKLELTNNRILKWEHKGELVQWCALVEPLYSGQVKVTSPEGAFGSTRYPSYPETFQIQALLTPEVTISSKAEGPVHGPFTVDIEFTYPVDGLELSDIQVVNGSTSNLAAAGATTIAGKKYATSYTATITPAATGTVTVNIAADAAQDPGGIGNLAAETFSIEANLDPPRAVLSGPRGLVNYGFEVRVTFNKAVSGLEVGDFQVLTEAAQRGVTVESDSFQPDDSLRDLGGASVAGDYEGQVFRLSFVPKENHRLHLYDSVFVTVTLPANTVQDRKGRSNQEAAQYKVEADLKKPAAVVDINEPSPITGEFSSTITFTEEVTCIDQDDVYVSQGAAITQFESPETDEGSETCYAPQYEAKVMPQKDGNIWIFVPGGVAYDRAGNKNQYGRGQGQVRVVHVQLERPGTSITGPAGPVGPRKFDIAIEFSKPVTGFTMGDITVVNGKLSDFAGSDASYTARVTPQADGAVTVDVKEGVATHTPSGGTPTTNLSAPQFQVTADLTRPTVSIEGPTAKQNSAFDIRIVFSEPVTGLTGEEVQVENGTLSDFRLTDAEKTPGRTEYTATITPAADGKVTVDVEAKVAQDAVGNWNKGPARFSVRSDMTLPTVAVGSSAPDVYRYRGRNYAAADFKVNVTFSEAVTGLTSEDIRLVNGAITGFVGKEKGKVYSATVEPSATGVMVEVDVPAGVAQDDSGNLNLASQPYQVWSEPPLDRQRWPARKPAR